MKSVRYDQIFKEGHLIFMISFFETNTGDNILTFGALKKSSKSLSDSHNPQFFKLIPCGRYNVMLVTLMMLNLSEINANSDFVRFPFNYLYLSTKFTVSQQRKSLITSMLCLVQFCL